MWLRGTGGLDLSVRSLLTAKRKLQKDRDLRVIEAADTSPLLPALALSLAADGIVEKDETC